MPKSSIDAKFLAAAWAMLDRANTVGVQCCVIWRLGDEEFTCASTFKDSSEVRAMLIEVVARTVIADGHDLENMADVAAADYLAASKATAEQRKKTHGET